MRLSQRCGVLKDDSISETVQEMRLSERCGVLKDASISVGIDMCKSLGCRTELEETKAQELSKLQEALHLMQMQVEEANVRVMKEREATRKAIEEAPPVIKETPVMVQDTAKIDALTAEVESLKKHSHLSQWHYRELQRMEMFSMEKVVHGFTGFFLIICFCWN